MHQKGLQVGKGEIKFKLNLYTSFVVNLSLHMHFNLILAIKILKLPEIVLIMIQPHIMMVANVMWLVF